MAPVDRNHPKRAKSSDARMTVMEFLREFPDDATCLEWLWRERFSPDGENAHCPKCDRERRFKKYDAKGRHSWTCVACGHHVSATAGTIFHKSSTSLQLWFHAMFLMASTRCGISAKQLEREIGVNYKTALRMFHLIREDLMGQNDDEPLSGEVEADETWIGGKLRNADRRAAAEAGVRRGPWVKPRPIVFGAVERHGRVRATVIPDSRAATVQGKIREYVLPKSLIYTDEYPGYRTIAAKGYGHRRIRHIAKVYVEGDIHTQTIDGFFGMLKDAIRGVHHGVSTKWLQGYVNEYAWRWNNREDEDNPGFVMFRALIKSAARA
jgi:transposase